VLTSSDQPACARTLAKFDEWVKSATCWWVDGFDTGCLLPEDDYGCTESRLPLAGKAGTEAV